MEAAALLVAQALSLSGLIGASGAYAGIVRRRQDHRLEVRAAAAISTAAVDRIDRHRTLARLDQTFIKSAYRPRDRRFMRDR